MILTHSMVIGRIGEDPVSLIHAIAAALMVAVKGQADVRVTLGYLALLCVWCYDSPRSIKDFLSEGAHLQFVSDLWRSKQ